jgi:hypothetical protein
LSFKDKVMSDLVDGLKNFLNTEEGKKSIEEFRLKIEREEAHSNRWVERMWVRIKDDVDVSIEHMLKWYDSDKYRDREYRMCYEPREDLLWVLYDVAQKYGNECTEDEIREFANTFTGGMMRIGSYVIQVMCGQGSVIRIDKI